MKTYFLIFVLAPFFCFAQQNGSAAAENKASATDCPTWKKKSVKPNKAEYFQYLKTSKSQKSLPASTVSNHKPANVRQVPKSEAPEAKEKSAVLNTEEKSLENTSVIKKKPTKTDVPKTTQALVVNDKENAEKIAPVAKPKEEKSIAKTEKTGEQNVDLEKSDKTNPEKNEKLEDEKIKTKQKLSRLTRKTTKVRKHSNSKCPAF